MARSKELTPLQKRALGFIIECIEKKHNPPTLRELADHLKKKSYGGYNGLLNLAEDLKNALENPVFKLVSRRAPWEK